MTDEQPPVQPGGWDPQQPTPMPVAPQYSPEVGGSAPKKGGPLAIIAFVLALIAFLLGIIPFIAGIAWLFAIPAIVLAIVALIKRTQPRWAAIVAIILGPVAWFVSIIVFFVSLAAGSSSFKQGFEAAVSASPNAVVSSSPVTVPSEAPSSAASKPKPSSPPSKKSNSDEASVGQTVTNNKGVAVTFTAVTCGLATAGDSFLQQTAKGQFCEVKYTVKNGSKDKIDLWATDITGLIGSTTYDTNDRVSYFGGEYNFTTDLNPGLSTDGIVYIDIPKDAKLNYVVYHPEFGLFTSSVKVKVP